MTIKAIETRYAGCLFRSRLEARWAVFFNAAGIKWEYEPQGFHVQWRLSRRRDCQHRATQDLIDRARAAGMVLRHLDGDQLHVTRPKSDETDAILHELKASKAEVLDLLFGCACEPATFQYLPDFWLPELGLWAEVKGQLDDRECERLLNAAASLSSNNGSGCHDSGGSDLLVLGPIETDRLPWRLHMHKGDLVASPWMTDDQGAFGCRGASIARDYGGSYNDITSDSEWCWPDTVSKKLVSGARCAVHPREHAVRAARSARFEHGQSGATR